MSFWKKALWALKNTYWLKSSSAFPTHFGWSKNIPCRHHCCCNLSSESWNFAARNSDFIWILLSMSVFTCWNRWDSLISALLSTGCYQSGDINFTSYIFFVTITAGDFFLINKSLRSWMSDMRCGLQSLSSELCIKGILHLNRFRFIAKATEQRCCQNIPEIFEHQNSWDLSVQIFNSFFRLVQPKAVSSVV